MPNGCLMVMTGSWPWQKQWCEKLEQPSENSITEPAVISCAYNVRRLTKGNSVYVQLFHSTDIIHSRSTNRIEKAPPVSLLSWSRGGLVNSKIFIESPFPSVCLCVCLSVCAIGCSFFRGLSLALRSHDQIPASHWSKKKEGGLTNERQGSGHVI